VFVLSIDSYTLQKIPTWHFINPGNKMLFLSVCVQVNIIPGREKKLGQYNYWFRDGNFSRRYNLKKIHTFWGVYLQYYCWWSVAVIYTLATYF